MIVLDTNIVSETMKAAPSVFVLDWLDAQEPSTLYLTTITLAEIGYGIEILPDGKRKDTLRERFDVYVSKGFEKRILVFHERAAHIYGQIMALRKRGGRPLSAFDGQIAAIALANGFVVATRNVSDFEGVDITIINPFQRTD
jgi:predicted nucleic acid-binding protein